MKPVNENATKEAKELLAYLYETAGKKIITGQHTQTNPMEEITYIHEKTGAYPKLQGFELLSYSPNINYADASEACLTEVTAQISCQIWASLILAQFTDTTFVIIIAKVIRFISRQNIHNPVVFILALMAFLGPFQPCRHHERYPWHFLRSILLFLLCFHEY